MPGRQAKHETVPGAYANFLSKAGKPLRDAACCASRQKNGAVIHNFCGQGQRKARLEEIERWELARNRGNGCSYDSAGLFNQASTG